MEVGYTSVNFAAVALMLLGTAVFGVCSGNFRSVKEAFLREVLLLATGVTSVTTALCSLPRMGIERKEPIGYEALLK